MAFTPITREDMQDPRLRAVVDKYGDDFLRKEKEERRRIMANVALIPLWALGVYTPMTPRTEGYDEAYVRQQQSRDTDMTRLDILAKHKKQIMELEEAGLTGSTQHMMAAVQALRSMAMIDISRNETTSAGRIARLEAKSKFYELSATNAVTTLDSYTKLEDKGAERARPLIAKTTGLADVHLQDAMATHMAQLKGDPYAQRAYILEAKIAHGEAAGDVIPILASRAVANATNARPAATGAAPAPAAGTPTAAEGTTTAEVKNYATQVEAIEAAKVKAQTEFDDGVAGIAKLSAGFGYDESTMNDIRAQLSIIRSSPLGNTDVSKSKSLGNIATDMVENEYTRLGNEQTAADAIRTPTYWAELEALVWAMPGFKEAYAEKGEPYGKTKLQFFDELLAADDKLDKEERQASERAEGMAKGIQKAEAFASGEVLNANALQRFVAKARVAANRAKRYITGDKSGRSEELEEIDTSALPEGKDEVDDFNKWRQEREAAEPRTTEETAESDRKGMKEAEEEAQDLWPEGELSESEVTFPDDTDTDTNADARTEVDTTVPESVAGSESSPDTTHAATKKGKKTKGKTHTEMQRDRDEARKARKDPDLKEALE